MVELFIIATSLAMDAFAVAICKGLNMQKLDKMQITLIALFFGGFQAGMPLIGWFIGSRFAHYITAVDHWVTFILLAIIGGNMIKESLGREECSQCCCNQKLNIKELLGLAVATSIDALAVGVTFAFQYEKGEALTVIGITGVITALLSATGVLIGHKFGAKYKNKAELVGGLVLVLMGVKFLLEGLDVL